MYIFVTYVLLYTDVTISFNQPFYNINENDGILQPVLVLSNPSSFDATVRVRDVRKTAKGE